MDTDGCILFACLGAVILIIRAFFAAFENAVTEINDQELKNLAQNNKRYERLNRLSTNPAKMLLTLSLQKTVSACAVTVCLIISLEGFLSEKLACISDASWLCALLSLLLSALFGALLILLTDFFPKTLTERSGMGFALFGAYPISLLITLFSPLTFLLSSADKCMRKLAGLSSKKKNEIVTEEKILMMLEAGNETGVIESSEKEMINNIFEFDDVSVNTVMTHRTDLIAADADTPVDDLIKTAIKEGFSRIPVYEDSIDKIIGIVYVKDLLCLIVDDSEKNSSVRRFMREVPYVPETNTCAEVFDLLTQTKNHIAVVVDEYGGTAGIVTMEDLIEEIVGNIQDEYDNEESELICISDSCYSIDGTADPSDILPQLGLVLPENTEYATMSALYVDLLGRIPDSSDAPAIQFMNYEFSPISVEDNRISRIKALKLPENRENI